MRAVGRLLDARRYGDLRGSDFGLVDLLDAFAREASGIVQRLPNSLFVLAVSALVLSACAGYDELASETRCVSAGKREEVCVSTRLSQPVNLHEPVAQTVTVTTRADSDSILVWVESNGLTAVVYDGPTEFSISTKAGEPTTVTTYLRIDKVGFYTFNALAEIEGVTDAALTGLTVEMTRDGGTVTP